MIWLAMAPVVIGLGLTRYADPLARQLNPNTAARLLTILSLTIALCTGLVLSVAAVLVCVQLGPLPSLGGWSARTVRTDMGFPDAVGIGALVIVVACLVAATIRATKSLHMLHSAHRAAKRLEPTTGDLVVIDDDVPIAYSVSGRHGRIVVSTSMLAALSAPERRVLIAHEASHLRHRHDLYLHLAELATAANPLLRPTAASIRRAIERWADEDAALAVGDRVLTGRALARAALASAGSPAMHHRLAIADDCVAERVQLLFAPVPIRKRWPVLVVVAGALVSWAAAALVTAWANNLVQIAESVYARRMS